MPRRTSGPRSARRAVSWSAVIPNVESAITTDAGPQLLRDCQRCRMSSAALAGAAFGSTVWIATGAVTAASGACAPAGASACGGVETEISAAGALARVASAGAAPAARAATTRTAVRAAASAGIAGFLLFGVSDRKDETAMLASERDHVVPRAIHAVKEAVPDLAVATDVCVCAYTAHGQCVLFGADGADAPATLERLGAIARVHAEAGADLLIPSGMLEGSVR